jgi:LL-diaminopimelate aminotransferase
MELNRNFQKLKHNYLFASISEKVREYQEKNPGAEIYRLGIGDVTKPLCPVVINAIQAATREMGQIETFRGYCQEYGYDFLREAVAKHYKKFNVNISADEVFISDGAKSDLGNILELFTNNNTVLILNPVYPAYIDANILDGREIVYIDATEENNFLPLPNNEIKADIIYICSPNNPTGAVYEKWQLQLWVDYALKNNAIILFDAAYEGFIEDDVPHSIFEIENAEECAIEISSLSKTAGFTGTRCGYTVISKKLIKNNMNLNKMWLRRQLIKFNGVAYIIQRAAEAVFSDEGQKQISENIKYYKENAKIMIKTMQKLNIFYTGGKNSPYVWFKCPKNMTSWEFFDFILNNANIVGTPGVGFGKNGEGFFRFSAFGNKEKTIDAIKKFEQLF